MVGFVCTKPCFKWLMCIISFSSYNNPTSEVAMIIASILYAMKLQQGEMK